MTTYHSTKQDPSRRPIRKVEVAHLVALGRAIREQRLTRGLTQVELAEAAELRPAQIQRIEYGTRRTRRSTLERIAGALVDPENVGKIMKRWVRLAGPALAPESPYADRMERRRRRRMRKRRKREEGTQISDRLLAQLLRGRYLRARPHDKVTREESTRAESSVQEAVRNAAAAQRRRRGQQA